MAEKDDAAKEQRKQSLFQKMTTTQNTKETIQTNKHLTEHGKQLGGILDGLNSVVASVVSVRDSINQLTNITASMAKVWDAQFDWQKKEDAEDETREKTKEIKAREDKLEETLDEKPEGEPSWLAKLLGKGKEKLQEGSVIGGLLTAVTGLGVTFREEIADAVTAIGKFGDRVVEGFNSTMNPFIETESEIAESEQEATNDVIQELRDGNAATTDQLRDLVKAQEKQRLIAEAKAKGEPVDADAIHEQVEAMFEDTTKYNRTKLEEMAREDKQNKALFAAKDQADIDRLQSFIAEEKKTLEGGQSMFDLRSEESWRELHEKKIADAEKRLANLQKGMSDTKKDLTDEDIEGLKAKDEELQELLDRQKELQEELPNADARRQRTVSLGIERLDKQIKEIEGRYDKLKADEKAIEPKVEPKPKTTTEAIKGSTDVMGEKNPQVDALNTGSAASGTITRTKYDKDGNPIGTETKELVAPWQKDQVEPKPNATPSTGNTGSKLNTQSKVIDATKNNVVAPQNTNVNAPTTNNNMSVNNSKTSFVAPSPASPRLRNRERTQKIWG